MEGRFNEAKVTYGCGPVGSRSDFCRRQNPAAVRNGIRAKRESMAELPPGANDLRDDRAIGTNDCYLDVSSTNSQAVGLDWLLHLS